MKKRLTIYCIIPYLIAWLLWYLIYIFFCKLDVIIEQNNQISSKFDYQNINITATINKAIDNQFNNINCTIWE